jgi:methionyl-tRNA formyltransferase
VQWLANVMPNGLKLVFCGSPTFALPTLEKLIATGHDIPLIVTQPDKPRGRGMALALSPVKQRAIELNLPITQPDKIRNNEEFRKRLLAIRPDAIVVVGYGRIIPQWMIDLPRLGNLNLHASLLPKYRGAAPMQWAIANGENITGVTTMRIDAGLDTGDILLQKEIAIAPQDTSETLAPRLAQAGADLMIETLRGLQEGAIQPMPQDETKATLAPILTKEDGRIDFHRSAGEIEDRLRGFKPWPGAYTSFRGKNLHLWDAIAAKRAIPERELFVEGESLWVGCGGASALQIAELQPEGKRRMNVRDFIHGYRPQTGEKLGEP